VIVGIHDMIDLPAQTHVPTKQIDARTQRRPWTIHLQRWGVPFLLFLLALIPRISSLNAFLTADEDDQLQFSAQFLEAVSHRDWAGALVLGYPGVPTMGLGALGIWVQERTGLFTGEIFPDIPTKVNVSVAKANEAVTDKPHTIYLPVTFGSPRSSEPPSVAVSKNPLSYIQAARLPLVLVSALVIVVIFWALRRLLGARLALVAALILAFDPFILGHSRILHVDAPLAYFMFAAFVTFILYLDQGGWPWLFASGVLGALAVLSKTPGVLLAPILVTSGLFYSWLAASSAHRRARLRRLGAALLAWGLIAALAFFALWPSMWARPGFALQHIVNNVISVTRFDSHPTSGVFWGPTRADRDSFYYLIVIPFHLTPLSTIGLLAGLGMGVTGFIQWRRGIQSLAVQHLPFLLSLLAYVVLFVAPVSLVARRGDRYILPVYFALDVLAALGLWWGVTTIGKAWLSLRGQGCSVFQTGHTFASVSLVLALQIAFVGLYHPYYLTYYNPLVGGYRTAPYLLNVGWGEGLDQVAAYLNQKPNAADLTVASWYSWQFDYFFRGHSIDLASNNPVNGADYTVFYINQVQRGFPSRELLDYFEDRVPEKVITLGGIDYAWIYPGPIASTEMPADLAQPLQIPFRQSVTLAGLDVPDTHQQDKLPVTLYWQTLQPLPGDYNVSIRLVDEQGIIWGQIDRFPLGGLIRTRSWFPGLVVRDEYMLPIDPGTPPGSYSFNILMYDFESGKIFGRARQVGEITILPSDAVVDVNSAKAKLPHQLEVQLAPNLNLIGHDLSFSELWPGQKQAVKLYWHAAEALKQDHTFSLVGRHVSGQEVTLLAESIGPVSYPTSRWLKGQVLAQAYTFAFPVDAWPGEYDLLVRGDSSEEALLGQVTLLEPTRIFDLPTGEAGAQIEPFEAQLGPDIQLSGYQLSTDHESVNLTLYWFAVRTPAEDYTVFVHLTDASGNIVAQRDTVPADGGRPTTTWLPAEFIVDSYHISLPPGEYTLWLGMYDPITGDRLPATSQSGPTSDNRIQIKVLHIPGL
jgi:4-amino-4-deoxy-L-arabinose transferase-like glycosyltransferase